MPSSTALRLQIETALATRIPGALTPRPRVLRELVPTGVAELDALLDGGLPLGAISELVGPHSSGRSTLALAALAEETRRGKTVAWIDASDTLDPECAAAAGLDLERLLWVRCGGTAAAASQPPSAPPVQRATLVASGSPVPAPSGGCGSPHPRGEARGLSEAVDAFLQQPDTFSRPAPPRDPSLPRRNRTIGTPGAPNRRLTDRTPQDARPFPRRAREREEQIPTDRQPSRRQLFYAQQGSVKPSQPARSLGTAQIRNTAAAAADRPRPGTLTGTWTDNRNNADGRCFATPPNAIAAGLPRFRELEARAAAAEQRENRPRTAASALPAAHSAAPTAQLPGIAVLPLPVPAAGTPAGKHAASLAGEPPPQGRYAAASPVWQALDQALRTTDLLLSTGGFSTVVVDLGNIPAAYAWRIPLATWFRFRAAADAARTVLLLLTRHPCARSSAELVLRLEPADARHAHTVLTGALFRVAVERQRFEGQAAPDKATTPPQPHAQGLHLVPPARKQPRAERRTSWGRRAAWTGTYSPAAPDGDQP